MKIHILYTRFYDRRGEFISIGGIQTYLFTLSSLLVRKNKEVCIYQPADYNFRKEYKGIEILGFKYSDKDAETELIKQCEKTAKKGDIVIFGTDTMISRTNLPSIGIQHGVSWDVPDMYGLYTFKYIKKAYKAWKRIQQIKQADTLVCVDHNFISWVRATAPCFKTRTIFIPNFTRIPDSMLAKHLKPNKVNIIFARRFMVYRGTRVFTEAIERIISEYSNVEFTVAGEGDDSQWLHDHLDKYSNIHFTKYKSKDSLAIHADKHIAIVPTIGSEGTSLSLLEAMASSCAVVCTDVGGMTDIVINDYNGKMVEAGNVEALYQALVELITNDQKRARLANKGYETVKEAFSYERWASDWEKIIKEVAGQSVD